MVVFIGAFFVFITVQSPLERNCLKYSSEIDYTAG